MKKAKNLLLEILRRVPQILLGTFLFDCPGLQLLRNCCYKIILKHMGKKNVLSSKILFYVPHGLPMASVAVGDYVRISEQVTIDCSSKVVIGDNVWISEHSRILNHEHRIQGRQWKESKAVDVTEGLEIGEDAWIGSNVIILPQVTRIGTGAIIGAGSVVTKNVEDYDIVAGNPAKKIGQR